MGYLKSYLKPQKGQDFAQFWYSLHCGILDKRFGNRDIKIELVTIDYVQDLNENEGREGDYAYQEGINILHEGIKDKEALNDPFRE